jgi:hypothetical protein
MLDGDQHVLNFKMHVYFLVAVNAVQHTGSYCFTFFFLVEYRFMLLENLRHFSNECIHFNAIWQHLFSVGG